MVGGHDFAKMEMEKEKKYWIWQESKAQNNSYVKAWAAMPYTRRLTCHSFVE